MSRYLTEESLGQLLITLYPNANIAKQFAMKIPGTGTKRIDYMVTTDDGMIAVEYDGHLHYTDPVRQLRDMLVKAHCAHRIGIVKMSIIFNSNHTIVCCHHIIDSLCSGSWNFHCELFSDVRIRI
jgi:hypothetical protein